MKKARLIVVCAMLIAMHTVLSFVGTIQITTFIKFSVASLPVILGGLLLGPAYGFVIGFLGHVIYQIISYPLSVFSFLYALAYAFVGLIAGVLGMLWKYDYSRLDRNILKAAVTAVVCTMSLTLLNTGVIYLQSTAEGWYTKEGVFGTLALKLLKNLFLCLAYVLILPPILRETVRYFGVESAVDREKKEQRRQVRAARVQRGTAEKAEAAKAIALRLEEAVPVEPGMTVLSYAPMSGEADPAECEKLFREAGGRVAYPLCGEEGAMEFYLAGGTGELNPGAYGIMEPAADPEKLVRPEEADLVIVPCMGFDEKCGRLGHGGGYYDRYLPRCPQAKRVCIAYEEQKLEKVAADRHDLVMDLVITPEAAYEGKRND